VISSSILSVLPLLFRVLIISRVRSIMSNSARRSLIVSSSSMIVEILFVLNVVLIAIFKFLFGDLFAGFHKRDAVEHHRAFQRLIAVEHGDASFGLLPDILGNQIGS